METRFRNLFRRAALGGLLASALLTGNVSFAQCVGGQCSIASGPAPGAGGSCQSFSCRRVGPVRRAVRWFFNGSCHRHCLR